MCWCSHRQHTKPQLVPVRCWCYLKKEAVIFFSALVKSSAALFYIDVKLCPFLFMLFFPASNNGQLSAIAIAEQSRVNPKLAAYSWTLNSNPKIIKNGGM